MNGYSTSLIRCVLFLFLLCVSVAAYSQQNAPKPTAAPDAPQVSGTTPKELKVIDEYSDGKGNLVRVIQYKLGVMKVTEKIIIPRVVTTLPPGYRVNVNVDSIVKDSVTIVVNKSALCLQVVYKRRVIRTYRAVFGPKPMENKSMEGDRCTPEGWFQITNKNPASKYHRFMQLNYPNDSSMARFNRLKSLGMLPAGARIGGNVGIHGIWEGGDSMIEMGVGWTDGCVALKNKDIEDLYSFVGVGTRVYIRK